MSRGVGHATTTTGRTEATTLTREGDESVLAAGVAMDAEESVGQHAALELGADLAFDEPGDGGACEASPGKEGHELRA